MGQQMGMAQIWKQIGPRFLPFADAATAELPIGRLLRLALFQVSVGMAIVLLNGTLNRVMIVELDIPAWLVATMVSLPLLFAPARVLIGFRSDNYKSVLGWRRVPYIWLGSMLQFGGLAVMPFALLVLSGDTHWPGFVGQAGAAFAFLMVGAGLHMTQTAGLALATDLATEESRPRVVALLYVMLLFGMMVSAVVFYLLLSDFSQLRLIQVVQGAAAITIVLNLIALWKQEARNPKLTSPKRVRPTFRQAWNTYSKGTKSRRLLLVVGLGTAAFSMQDILLEPYGGEVLHLSVGETTFLTALLAAGTLVGLAVSARLLGRGGDPYRLAAMGIIAGIFAFSAVIFADPLASPTLFRIGTTLIGFGGGLFAVAMLTAAMNLAKVENGVGSSPNPSNRAMQSGMALGAWGAVQATAAGIAIALGGVIRDGVASLASDGFLGTAMSGPAAGYGVVYHIEIALLFFTLIAIGPLVGRSREHHS
ncbi:MAG: BCD family MFS transporter, partial [Pseudomonadota bacterium]